MKLVTVITGASSGFGALAARALATAGHIVYAGMRDTNGRNAPQVTLAREYAAKNRVDLRALELDVVSDARWYAKRANSHKAEVSGASHSVYVSRPKEVAALIEEAAAHARYDLDARSKGANP